MRIKLQNKKCRENIFFSMKKKEKCHKREIQKNELFLTHGMQNVMNDFERLFRLQFMFSNMRRYSVFLFISDQFFLTIRALQV